MADSLDNGKCTSDRRWGMPVSRFLDLLDVLHEVATDEVDASYGVDLLELEAALRTMSPEAAGAKQREIAAVLVYPTNEQMDRYRERRRSLAPHDPGMFMDRNFVLMPHEPTP